MIMRLDLIKWDKRKIIFNKEFIKKSNHGKESDYHNVIRSMLDQTQLTHLDLGIMVD